jgi:hypothetical protein
MGSADFRVWSIKSSKTDFWEKVTSDWTKDSSFWVRNFLLFFCTLRVEVFIIGRAARQSPARGVPTRRRSETTHAEELRGACTSRVFVERFCRAIARSPRTNLRSEIDIRL